MFSQSIRHFHLDISEQSTAQLREFIVTAHQKHLTDSRALLIGMQDLKQAVLDAGFDWNDLFTNLVELLSADMQEEQHERFVAELDRLYAINASLMEVGFVMKANYPGALEGLKLLIEEAQKEHEALAGMAGGTSRHSQSSPERTSDQHKREKAELIVGGVMFTGIGTGAGIGYANFVRARGIEERTGRQVENRAEGLVENRAEGLVENGAEGLVENGTDRLAGLAARGSEAEVNLYENAQLQAKEIADKMTAIMNKKPIEFRFNALNIDDAEIGNISEAALGAHWKVHPEHIEKALDQKFYPRTRAEIDSEDSVAMQRARAEIGNELRAHYRARIAEFREANPDELKMTLDLDTNVLIDTPDYRARRLSKMLQDRLDNVDVDNAGDFQPDDLDPNSLADQVMNDQTSLNNNLVRAGRQAEKVAQDDVNFRKVSHEAKRFAQDDSSEISQLKESDPDLTSELGGIQRQRTDSRGSGAIDDGIGNMKSEIEYDAEIDVGEGKEVAETEVKAEARAAAAEAGADIEAGARNVARDTEAAVDDAM